MRNHGLQPFLHMDDQWMWRFYFLDAVGKLAAMSTLAYFTRAEAEEAMIRYRESIVTMPMT
jgi:hypothetical protein